MSNNTTPPTAVTPAAILDALHQLDRLGHHRLMHRLEAEEPDLTGHALESLSTIHRDLLKLGAPARSTRALYRRIEAMTLVLICAGRARQVDTTPTVDPLPPHGAESDAISSSS